MIRPEFRRRLLEVLGRVLFILWTGMLGSPVILVGVTLLSRLRRAQAAAGGGGVVVAVLDGLAALVGLAAIALRSRLLDVDRLLDRLPMDVPTAAGTDWPTAEQPGEERALQLAGRVISRSLIVWACADAVAVCGFAATVLSGEPTHVQLLAGLSLALLLLVLRPPLDRLKEGLDRIERGFTS
jgi:hypothetical protein